MERGSPLKFYGEDNEKQLQTALSDEYVVKLAMRYQSPSIESGLKAFQKMGLNNIVVIPFFPQYASASTGSVYEEVMRIVTKWQVIPEIKIHNYFYDKPKFIKAFADNGRKHLEKYNYEHVLFSYHGLP